MEQTAELTCAVLGACCRQGKIEEAVIFAQASLSPMRGLLTHRNRAYDAMLHDVVALLAYEDPLVRPPLPSCLPLAQSWHNRPPAGPLRLLTCSSLVLCL